MVHAYTRIVVPPMICGRLLSKNQQVLTGVRVATTGAWRNTNPPANHVWPAVVIFPVGLVIRIEPPHIVATIVLTKILLPVGLGRAWSGVCGGQKRRTAVIVV